MPPNNACWRVPPDLLREGTPPALLATRSEGKLAELLPLFRARCIEVETLRAAGLSEEPAESGIEEHATFEANALAKARWFHQRSGGRMVFAEDSGLEVDALFGAPGVHSKRWAGCVDAVGDELDRANNARLLGALADAARAGRASRRARFVCAACCVWPGGELVVRGIATGLIASTARGAHGFGYDPYFVSDDAGATFSELSREAKALVSHRGRAFAALCVALSGGDLTRVSAAVG